VVVVASYVLNVNKVYLVLFATEMYQAMFPSADGVTVMLAVSGCALQQRW
jgi:hypothetical protein